jgi:hypothetical protein
VDKYLKTLIIIVGVLAATTSCSEVEMKQFGQQVLSGVAAGETPLSLGEIDAGLREALKVGSERVVQRLGRADGFNGDPKIRIPLPEELEKARKIAAKVGLDRTFNDLEIRLNRAAEKAAPLAKELFWQAIREMSIADIREIYNGPDDAATRYFAGKMSPHLTVVMRPVVDKSLARVGAVQVYQKLLREYNAIPFVPKIEADLTAYVVSGGMDGIFHYLAEEEAEIRHNPAKRTSEILRRVFGR